MQDPVGIYLRGPAVGLQVYCSCSLGIQQYCCCSLEIKHDLGSFGPLSSQCSRCPRRRPRAVSGGQCKHQLQQCLHHSADRSNLYLCQPDRDAGLHPNLLPLGSQAYCLLRTEKFAKFEPFRLFVDLSFGRAQCKVRCEFQLQLSGQEWKH